MPQRFVRTGAGAGACRRNGADHPPSGEPTGACPRAGMGIESGHRLLVGCGPMSAGMHLLVVDDDTSVLDLLRRYFTGHGFEVSVAADGAEMRGALARTNVDL